MDLTLQTLAPVFTLIGVFIIGAIKAYERVNAPGSVETWDKTKFGLFVIVAIVIMGLEYVVTGNTEFPADELITSGIAMITPIMALFGLTYTTIVAGKLVKNDVVVPVVASIKAGAGVKALSSAGGFAMGYTVTPTYTEGKSPLPVTFKIYATQVQPDHPGVTSVDIDWGDSSSQNVPLKAGYAEVGHIFTFVKTDKYTGHTFYPVFIFNGSDGSRNYFNVEGKGVEIWVQSL